MTKFKRIDIGKIKTLKVAERKTKSGVKGQGKPVGPDDSISAFLGSLPDYLKGRDILLAAENIARARHNGRAIVWMMGAHPIKVGLSPIIIDLLEKGFITHLALNGAGAIHDLEMAFFGRTSEEVSEGLADGSFGMVEETPRLFFEAASLASAGGLGLGEGLGKYISDKCPETSGYSILKKSFELNIPVSVHVAIGTDTICQHPGFDGAAIGKLSHDDFLVLCESLKGLSGGAVLNIGSAVILPEVFLKALTVARNIYGGIDSFTAINFDMIQHYRPNTNVVKRPTDKSGTGLSFTGHHEIMIPLLAVAIKDKYRTLPGRE